MENPYRKRRKDTSTRIEKWEKKRVPSDIILSTDEVLEIREVDLENFIVDNLSILGRDLTLKRRQVDTSAGRLDLLLEDKDKKELIVVELKLNEIGRGAINQLRRYIHELRKRYKERKVRGIIVCKDVLPAFVNEVQKLRDIQIYHYGWKLTVYPRARE